jgi:hypothetical protein
MKLGWTGDAIYARIDKTSRAHFCTSPEMYKNKTNSYISNHVYSVINTKGDERFGVNWIMLFIYVLEIRISVLSAFIKRRLRPISRSEFYEKLPRRRLSFTLHATVSWCCHSQDWTMFQCWKTWRQTRTSLRSSRFILFKVLRIFE